MAKQERRKAQLVADQFHWLAPHDEAKTWLAKLGYSPATIVELTRLLSCWSEWARSAGYDRSA